MIVLRSAVLGSLAIAAVVTPTPDIPTLLPLAGQMVVLYGADIGWPFGRRRTTGSLAEGAIE